MKRCGYCGKYHPDEAVVCSVDSEPLIPIALPPVLPVISPEPALPPEIERFTVPSGLPEVRGIAVGGNGGGNHIVAILGAPVNPPTLQPMFTNGQFRVQLRGDTNRMWIIQASTDLLNWVQLSRVTNVTGNISIPDSGATNFSRRFYRAISP